MVIEEVIQSAAEGPNQQDYYLHEPGSEKIHLAGGRCPADAPSFLADERILIHACNGRNSVINKQARKVYDLPALSFPYIALDHDGHSFAAYERNTTLLHQFEGTNRLRVRVFRSSDGKKLFEYRWNPVHERTNDGRVALSEDGSIVALAQAGEILVFRIPAQP